MTKRVLPLVLLPLAACSSTVRTPAPADAAPAADVATSPPTDAASLIRAMHDRYAGRWYHTMSFQQKTSRVLPNDSVTAETWYEWGALPGRLRIQQGDASAGRGAIYARDSTYIIRGDTVFRRMAGRNPLMLLGFDIYAQPPERSLEMLREDGFALDRFHADTLDGKKVWVVGGAPGDLRAKQFWVEQDRLLFVRLLEPSPNPADSTIQDIRFANYVPAGKGWIAALVEVHVKGKRVFWEEYSDIRADPPFDSAAAFDPGRWKQGPRPAAAH